MEEIKGNKYTTECEAIALKQFKNTLKLIIKEISEFNSTFNLFLEEQRKQARELWTLVVRYNIINVGPPFAHIPPTLIMKEEILEELIIKIQEKTTNIYQALQSIINKFDQLPKYRDLLQSNSEQLDWNITSKTHSVVKGSISHRSFSQCLEEIADILFQYDISITCMNQYFESLNINDSNTYQNLLNSFTLSKEHIDFVKEFEINFSMILH